MISSLALSLALLGQQDPVAPASEDDGYRLVDAFPAQKKLDKPLYLDHHASDPDVYYVVEQDGMIYRIPRDGSRGERHVFLDWTEKVYTQNWEEGLLGFAFDPSFADTGDVYVYYTQSPGGGRRQSVISRLETTRDDQPLAHGDTEVVLMTVPQPYGNHNGGTIVFGPDGMLYVALGDGGSANDPHGNGQNPRTLLASILRIDVSHATPDEPYRIPADNPFVDRMDEGVRGEIWAYGLRNVWRMSFDAKTGDLWAADVGQNKWEEVDRIVKGGNYGWNVMEGRHEFRRPEGSLEPGELVAPVVEYGHDLGLSITGGYVYRGRKLPELDGYYVYGDFVTGRIWAVREGGGGGEPDVMELCKAPASIASFAEEPDGELLVLSFDGRIYRLVR